MSDPQKSIHQSETALKRLRQRKARETRFKMFGIASIVVAIGMLMWLLTSVIGSGYKAFYQHHITLEVTFTESVLDPQNLRDPEQLRGANYRKIVQDSLYARYPDVSGR